MNRSDESQPLPTMRSEDEFPVTVDALNCRRHHMSRHWNTGHPLCSDDFAAGFR
jgi:hypothetical protein